MHAYEHARTEPQVTDFDGQVVTCRTDENHLHSGVASVGRSNALEINNPEGILAAPPRLNPTTLTRRGGRRVTRFPEQLQLHPALKALGWTGAIDELNNAARLTNQSVPEPILIAPNGVVLAGFGRWQLAVSGVSGEIECIEYPLSEDEALQFILVHHQTRRGWNPFVRIRLALTLETLFQKRALDNMRAGGKHKGSSNLTGAGKVDVRAEIAAVAGVSTGNVTKVKQLTESATVEILEALRSDEISIHRAWLWSKESAEKQIDALWAYRSEKVVKKTIRQKIGILVGQLQPKDGRMVGDLETLTRRLSGFDFSKFDPIRVVMEKIPGKIVVLSEELIRTIGLQEELILK